jgi:hypothetical protein
MKLEAMRRLGAVVRTVESGREESDAAREAAAGEERSLVHRGRRPPRDRRRRRHDRPGDDSSRRASRLRSGPDRRRRPGHGHRLVAESHRTRDASDRRHHGQCPRDGGLGRRGEMDLEGSHPISGARWPAMPSGLQKRPSAVFSPPIWRAAHPHRPSADGTIPRQRLGVGPRLSHQLPLSEACCRSLLKIAKRGPSSVRKSSPYACSSRGVLASRSRV